MNFFIDSAIFFFLRVRMTFRAPRPRRGVLRAHVREVLEEAAIRLVDQRPRGRDVLGASAQAVHPRVRVVEVRRRLGRHERRGRERVVEDVVVRVERLGGGGDGAPERERRERAKATHTAVEGGAPTRAARGVRGDSGVRSPRRARITSSSSRMCGKKKKISHRLHGASSRHSPNAGVFARLASGQYSALTMTRSP